MKLQKQKKKRKRMDGHLHVNCEIMTTLNFHIKVFTQLSTFCFFFGHHCPFLTFYSRHMYVCMYVCVDVPKISNNYSKRWRESNHIHNFWYFWYAFILHLLLIMEPPLFIFKVLCFYHIYTWQHVCCCYWFLLSITQRLYKRHTNIKILTRKKVSLHYDTPPFSFTYIQSLKYSSNNKYDVVIDFRLEPWLYV